MRERAELAARALKWDKAGVRVLSLLWVFLFLLWSGISQANVMSSNVKPQALEGIAFDQNLNHQVPTDLTFNDESGKAVRLSDFLGQKPAILVLAYYECPRLCTLVLNGVGDAMSKTKLKLGKDYQIITVSINPKDTPRLATEKKATYIEHYFKGQSGGAGWHFLTGTQASITRLADAVGFKYRYDKKSGEFYHASGIMVLTPKGLLSHYFYGITYSPRDLRLALVEASNGKIGSPVDKFLLYCCDVDLTSGRYTASIMKIMQVMCFGFLAVLAVMILILWRYKPPEWHSGAKPPSAR